MPIYSQYFAKNKVCGEAKNASVFILWPDSIYLPTPFPKKIWKPHLIVRVGPSKRFFSQAFQYQILLNASAGQRFEWGRKYCCRVEEGKALPCHLCVKSVCASNPGICLHVFSAHAPCWRFGLQHFHVLGPIRHWQERVWVERVKVPGRPGIKGEKPRKTLPFTQLKNSPHLKISFQTSANIP